MRSSLLLACAVALVGCQAPGDPADDPSEEPLAVDGGMTLARFTWNASPEAWEPAKNPVYQVAGRTITRAEHRWAAFAPSVGFECQLRGKEVWAVNPLPNEPAPELTPHVWDRTSLLGNVAGVSVTQGAVGPATDVDVTPYPTRPGCFGLKWSARMHKTGATLAYTPPLGGGPNPLGVQPFSVQLDDDMDDKLSHQVEICCCTWDKSVPEAADGDTLQGEPAVQRGVADEVVRAVEKPQDVLESYGIDWVATERTRPATRNDAATEWRGSYELKQCGFATVQVQGDGDRLEDRRQKSRDYDPADEARDADDVPLNGL